MTDTSVRVTITPQDADANDVLRDGGPNALTVLITTATEDVALTADGEIRRLARLDPLSLEFAQQCLLVKQRHKLTLATIRGAVTRQRRMDEAKAAPPPPTSPTDEAAIPWPEQVHLSDTLDEFAAQLQRFVSTSPENITIGCLWVVIAHLMHHPRVILAASPKVYVTAAVPDCGKSTLTDCLGLVTPRTHPSSSLTGSSVFRVIDEKRPTLIIHEADQIFRRHRTDDLVSVINSSHKRREAFVDRTEKTDDGSFKSVQFSTWAAMAIDGIGPLPPQTMTRCLVLWMYPATPDEFHNLEQLDLCDHTPFIEINRKFVRWADDLDDLDLRPPIPTSLHNRAGINWQALFAIAYAAGEKWVARLEQAAAVILERDGDDEGTLSHRLLASVHAAFEKQAEIDRDPARRRTIDSHDFLRTETLVAYLLADPAEQWARANKGHPINPLYLRHNLKLLIKRDLKRKDAGRDASGKRQRPSGYYRHQFIEAWHRYLGWIEQPITAQIVLPLLRCTATAVQGQVQPSPVANGANGDDPPDRKRTRRKPTIQAPPAAEQPQTEAKDAAP